MVGKVGNATGVVLVIHQGFVVGVGGSVVARVVAVIHQGSVVARVVEGVVV